MDGWYNFAGVPTTPLLEIQIWTPLSLLFSCQNHDTLPGIGVHDDKMLISISKVLGDAFCGGIEWATKEDVIGGVWHDLHLEVNVDVIKGEVDIAEAAVCFSDGGVGGLHLQHSFYL
jgi:hypothetical protein